MTHEFDKEYWQRHWEHPDDGASEAATGKGPHPYVVRETLGLMPGTALDAGCGEGAEAIWLAAHGWSVTAADIAAEALTRAAVRAAGNPAAALVQWVAADLTAWAPDTQFDLVMTSYAHPAMPQLTFYERISGWVAPGGTLLIVGHVPAPGSAADGHHPPAEASVTVADITAGLDGRRWEIVTAAEHARTDIDPGGRAVPLRDAVVRAMRRHSQDGTSSSD